MDFCVQQSTETELTDTILPMLTPEQTLQVIF